MSNTKITNGGLTDSSVTEEKLADSAVTENKIADDAVTTDKIADTGITFAKIASGAIASQAEAEAGTATDKLMTPEQTTQAIAALGGTKILGYGIQTTSARVIDSTGIPADDSIPTSSEGTEVLTITYDRQSATSTLIIECGTFVSAAAGESDIILALFQDAGASAISVTSTSIASGQYKGFMSITHYMTSGATGNTTFKIRFGSDGGTTSYVNGDGGSRSFGGVANTYIKVTELE